jgi:hypothetical protein
MFKGVVAIKPLLFFDITQPPDTQPPDTQPPDTQPPDTHPTCRINLYLVSIISMIPPHQKYLKKIEIKKAPTMYIKSSISNQVQSQWSQINPNSTTRCSTLGYSNANTTTQ